MCVHNWWLPIKGYFTLRTPALAFPCIYVLPSLDINSHITDMDTRWVERYILCIHICRYIYKLNIYAYTLIYTHIYIREHRYYGSCMKLVSFLRARSLPSTLSASISSFFFLLLVPLGCSPRVVVSPLTRSQLTPLH